MNDQNDPNQPQSDPAQTPTGSTSPLDQQDTSQNLNQSQATPTGDLNSPWTQPTESPTSPQSQTPPSLDSTNSSVSGLPTVQPSESSSVNQPTWQSPSPFPQQQTNSITPQTPPESTQAYSDNLSPLDNPWGAPTQTPPIDGGSTQPPSTFEPAAKPQSVETTPQPSFTTPQPIPNPADLSTLTSAIPQIPPQSPITESAPTDLSHLIGNNSQPENNIPQQETAETLVAPSANTGPDVPTTSQVEHKGIPKWVIGVGIGLLILVAGASAYFILGIGQAPDTTSIPATQAPKATQQVKPPAPLPTTVSQPAATGSASFDQLQGGGSGGQQATSAADLLRQRQQQGR